MSAQAAEIPAKNGAGEPAGAAGSAPAGVSRFLSQRNALEQVMGLSSRCATDYHKLEEQRQRALREAEEGFERARGSTQDTYSARRYGIERHAESAVAAAEQAFEEASRRIHRQAAGERNELDQKQRSTNKKLAKEHSDGVWLVDTMLEGETSRIEEATAAVVKAVNEDAERLAELRRRAEGLFARFGQSVPPAAAEELAAERKPADLEELRALLDRRHDTAQSKLLACQKLLAPRLFLGTMPWFMAAVVLLIAAAVGQWLSVDPPRTIERLTSTPPDAGTFIGTIAVAAGLTAAAWWWLRGMALRKLNDAGHHFSEAVALAESAAQADRKALKHKFDEELLDAKLKHTSETHAANARNERHLKAAKANYEALLNQIVSTGRAAEAEATRTRDTAIAEAQQRLARELAELDRWRDSEVGSLQRKREDALAAAEQAYRDGRAELVNHWARALQITRDLSDESDRPEFAAIDDWRAWRPPHNFAPTVRFGELAVDMRRFMGEAREVERGQAVIGASNGDGLRLPLPEPYTVPALLAFPDYANLLIKYEPEGRDAAVATLRLTMLRLLTSLPPGRVQFTLIDPVGLGRSFAGFMHLADFDEDLVGGRVWTESDAIETRLTDLTDHMETVIQKYLRNEFETIDAYNAQAGELAEPYRFVVIADLPTGFSEKALSRLASIATSGSRCGVHVLAALDIRHSMRGSETFLEDLERHCSVLVYEKGQKPESRDQADVQAPSERTSDLRPLTSSARFRWNDPTFGRLPLSLDEPPDESGLTDVLRVLGQAAHDAKRVEVPFTAIAPAESQIWSRDSASDLHVPVGRTGATRHQSFRLGRGVAQHALIAGKTGSGKSTLLNVLITNLALWYAPDQLELYLVDFKRGVEFMAYAKSVLPHARAVAVESDREFGLSVLQRLDEELARRGDLFRAAGVQDLASYRRMVARDQTSELSAQRAEAAPASFPRVLLIVDEFQELFSEDDKLTQDAALLIDRLVRQGRAFGIHVILGSQTIGGQAGLGRATLGQMAVRVALQCTEADSQLILGDNNTAARLLSRPGEAIYNDAGGAVENNSPFQVSWLDDTQRDALLRRIRQRAQSQGIKTSPPIVFEGNAAANLAENQELRAALAGNPVRRNAIYLGDPVAIKEPTHLQLRRQAGANVVVVGQQEENVLGVVASALLSLSATAADTRGRRLEPRFVVLDGTPRDAARASYIPTLASKLPAQIDLVDYRAVPEAFADLSEELRRRIESGAPDEPPLVLLIHGIQRYRNLTRSDDFAFSAEPRPSSLSDLLEDGGDAPRSTAPAVRPDQVLIELLREGPLVGMHVVVTADTLASLERRMSRDTLREFDARVLFQMSGNDSSVFLDSLEASRLGFYRGLLASEELGTVEKFRPYAPPDPAGAAGLINLID